MVNSGACAGFKRCGACESVSWCAAGASKCSREVCDSRCSAAAAQCLLTCEFSMGMQSQWGIYSTGFDGEFHLLLGTETADEFDPDCFLNEGRLPSFFFCVPLGTNVQDRKAVYDSSSPRSKAHVTALACSLAPCGYTQNQIANDVVLTMRCLMAYRRTGAGFSCQTRTTCSPMMRLWETLPRPRGHEVARRRAC